MNRIIIKGRLVRDPELRRTESGTAVCNASVAVDRPYAKDEADFIDCVFWQQTAEFVSKYFIKGREILIEGVLQSRKWKDKDGNNRIAWEVKADRVEFCGGRNDAGASDDEEEEAPKPAKKSSKSSVKSKKKEEPAKDDGEDGEEDLPF